MTDKPDSPHLLIPKMKAEVLCAVAANDDKRDPTAKDKLKEAFAAAHLKATVEVYGAATMAGRCVAARSTTRQEQSGPGAS